MYAYSMRLVGTALLASFVLQACVNVRATRDTSSELSVAQEQRAEAQREAEAPRWEAEALRRLAEERRLQANDEFPRIRQDRWTAPSTGVGSSNSLGDSKADQGNNICCSLSPNAPPIQRPVGLTPTEATNDASTLGAVPQTPAQTFLAESGKIDGLVKGSAAVSAPSRVTSGDSFAVYLRVSPDKLGDVIQSLQDEFPDNKTVKGKQGVKLTPRMTAVVSGFGFEVAPKEGQPQAVSANEPTTWSWQVKAIESGVHTLTFTLSGALTIEGKEVARRFYEYQQKVQVEVSPMGFVEKYWQWLVTTLAIPAVGALWAVFRRPMDSDGRRQKSIAEKLRELRRLKAV